MAKCKECIHKDVCYLIEHYGKDLCSDDACDKFLVTPVVHGHWKGYITSAFYGCDDEGEPIYRDANFNVCSECGRKTVVKEKFCPNCGAKNGR